VRKDTVGAFLLGIAFCAIGLLVLAYTMAAINFSRPVPIDRGVGGAAPGAPLTKSALAAKVAPRLVQALQNHKNDIVAAAGNPVERLGVKMGWQAGMREVPVLTEIGVEEMGREISRFSGADLVRFLEALARESPPNPYQATADDGRLLRELKAKANDGR
jgi:hypothetical protein